MHRAQALALRHARGHLRRAALGAVPPRVCSLSWRCGRYFRVRNHFRTALPVYVGWGRLVGGCAGVWVCECMGGCGWGQTCARSGLLLPGLTAVLSFAALVVSHPRILSHSLFLAHTLAHAPLKATHASCTHTDERTNAYTQATRFTPRANAGTHILVTGGGSLSSQGQGGRCAMDGDSGRCAFADTMLRQRGRER